MTIKIVFTGGPCSGKTTIINILKEKYGYSIIEENAQKLIEENICKNKNEKQLLPWIDLLEFQKELFRRQLDDEEEIEEKNEKIVFLDRGIYDNIAYLKFANKYEKEIFSIEKNRYDLVFIFENINNLENNKIRKENENERKLISKHINNVYYEKMDREKIIFVKFIQIEKREEFVLKKIEEILKDKK